MFGRLLLVLAVMWRLCSPQTAFAFAEQRLAYSEAGTRIAAKLSPPSTPCTFISEQDSEETREAELDDTDPSGFELSPALPPSLWFWSQALLSAGIEPARYMTHRIPAQAGHAALFVLFGQFRL